jgi:glycosyltransferase involved in cell wall biosynthesis
MRILLSSRVDAKQRPGGDSIHMRTLADELRRRGHLVYDSDEELEQAPDILFHFNLGRPEQALDHLNRFPNARVFVQTIFVDYRTTDEHTSAGTLRKSLSSIIGAGQMELLKELGRWLKGQRGFPSWAYLARGHDKSVQAVLDRAERIFSASKEELFWIKGRYRIHQEACETLLPPLSLFYFDQRNSRKPKVRGAGGLCVARIEPLKNQLSLIRAWKESFGTLHLVGDPAPNHQAYFKECTREAAGKPIDFHSAISVEAVRDLYDQIPYHFLPSLMETTGLSTVECLARGGTALVGDRTNLREIFGERVHYCKPTDIEALTEYIAQMQATPLTDHSQWVQTHFHPAAIADRIEAYF